VSGIYEKLKAMFGEEFARQYVEKLQQKRKLPAEVVEEIKNWALNEVKIQELPDAHAKYENYDVFLVTTPGTVQVKNTGAGNWKVGFLSIASEDGWLSGFFSDREDAYSIEEDSVYLLIGKAKEREYLGVKRISMNVLGFVKLDSEVQPQEEPQVEETPVEVVEEETIEEEKIKEEVVEEKELSEFSPLEQQILELISDQPMRVKDIAEHIGESERTVRAVLTNLGTDGYVAMVKRGLYRATKKGREALSRGG